LAQTMLLLAFLSMYKSTSAFQAVLLAFLCIGRVPAFSHSEHHEHLRRASVVSSKGKLQTGSNRSRPTTVTIATKVSKYQKYAYVGCYEGNHVKRPYGDTPNSIQGVQRCRDLCAKGGFEYFGFECPRKTLHCECGSGSGAKAGKKHPIQKCKEFNARSGKHCVGPFTASGSIGTYALGAGSIGSLYETGECPRGHHKTATACKLNTCSCASGTGAKGEECQQDGTENCTSCNPSYALNGGKCQSKTQRMGLSGIVLVLLQAVWFHIE